MKLKLLPKIEDRLSEFRAQHRTHFRNPRTLRYSKQLLLGDFTNRVLDQVPASVNLTMLQGKSNRREEPKMGIAQAALAKAAELRKNKPSTSTKKSTAPVAKKQRAASTGTRGTTEAENAKVVKMYKEGKNYGEISDAMGWTGKGDWPHSYTHGVINRLRKAGLLGYRRKPETKSVAKKGKK